MSEILMKDYIGDGVYITWDGYGFQLRNNDFNNPTDIIYLEPSVVENLNEFVNKCAKIKKGD